MLLEHLLENTVVLNIIDSVLTERMLICNLQVLFCAFAVDAALNPLPHLFKYEPFSNQCVYPNKTQRAPVKYVVSVAAEGKTGS